MKSLLAISAAAMLAASPALAQDHSWTGAYLGGHVGYGSADWDGTLSTNAGCPGTCPDAGFTDPSRSISGDGVIGGGQLGYNWQFANSPIVVGFEADISWADIDGDGTFATDKYNPWVWSKRHSLSLDYFGTARARVGYAAGKFMPYITGGFAWAQTSGTLAVSQSHDGTGTIIDGTSHAWSDDTHTGWTVGAGAEYRLSEHLSLKAEYLYLDLGKADYHFDGGTVFDAGAVPFNTDSFSSDLTMHVARMGLNWHF